MSSTGRGDTVREIADNYPTPGWVVQRFVERVPLSGGHYLEPCAGDGNIVKTIGHHKDIVWTACETRPECKPWLEPLAFTIIGDFLTHDFDKNQFEAVFTNPPFSLALEFIQKSITLAKKTIVLLRVNWLETAVRYPFLSEHVPDVYVLPNRPSFVGKGTDSTAYCWAVFHQEKRTTGSVEILSLTPRTERMREKRTTP